MGMLRTCSAAGCETKTLGLLCVDHERTLATAADRRTTGERRSLKSDRRS